MKTPTTREGRIVFDMIDHARGCPDCRGVGEYVNLGTPTDPIERRCAVWFSFDDRYPMMGG